MGFEQTSAVAGCGMELVEGPSSLTTTTQMPAIKLDQAQLTGTAPPGLALTPKLASKASEEQLSAWSTKNGLAPTT